MFILLFSDVNELKESVKMVVAQEEDTDNANKSNNSNVTLKSSENDDSQLSKDDTELKLPSDEECLTNGESGGLSKPKILVSEDNGNGSLSINSQSENIFGERLKGIDKKDSKSEMPSIGSSPSRASHTPENGKSPNRPQEDNSNSIINGIVNDVKTNGNGDTSTAKPLLNGVSMHSPETNTTTATLTENGHNEPALGSSLLQSTDDRPVIGISPSNHSEPTTGNSTPLSKHLNESPGTSPVCATKETSSISSVMEDEPGDDALDSDVDVEINDHDDKDLLKTSDSASKPEDKHIGTSVALSHQDTNSKIDNNESDVDLDTSAVKEGDTNMKPSIVLEPTTPNEPVINIVPCASVIDGESTIPIVETKSASLDMEVDEDKGTPEQMLEAQKESTEDKDMASDDLVISTISGADDNRMSPAASDCSMSADDSADACLSG